MFNPQSYAYIRTLVILLFLPFFALLLMSVQALSNPRSIPKNLIATTAQTVVFEPRPILPDNYDINSLSSVMQVDIQIKRLENELLELLTTHTERHPSVITLQRKLNTLRAGGKQPSKSKKGNLRVTESTITAVIHKLELQLQSLGATHTDKHPDVIILQRQLETLRKKQKNLKN